MRWTVTYSPSAENELTEIWLASVDQEVVARAADQIDELLESDPLNAGESREHGSRIVVKHPLAVEYVIREDDCIVIVKTVRQWRRR